MSKSKIYDMNCSIKNSLIITFESELKKGLFYQYTSLELRGSFFSFCVFKEKDLFMDIYSQIIPFVESVGFPALIFAIWYIYHQSQVKAFELIVKDNFEILKDLLETNQYHAAILSRVENKIDNNLWCPILKKEFLK